MRFQKKARARRRWQALFFLLLAAVAAVNLVPELRASALYLITDGNETVVVGETAPVAAEQLIFTGVRSADTELILTPEQKVTVRHGGAVDYATTRQNESVNGLLRRLQLEVGPLEMVRIDLSGDEVTIDVASDFIYYETAVEASAHATVEVTDYHIAKGETEVVQKGEDGTVDVVYEVVYADGQLVSRQAVTTENDTSVTEEVHIGTLVSEAEAGDTIVSVVEEEDGGGYLILQSGDALHFTGTMDVKCTAYTAGHGGVGTKTYTGTTVHVGVVAVDKSVIPLGSYMFITTANGKYTYGMAHAEDTGVRGAKVDLYMDTYEECMSFGVRNSIVYFLDPPTE